MAITDIKAYAHLTEEDVENLARELDQLRADIEESRGERDARYIRRSIQLQRALAAGGRIALFASSSRIARYAGTRCWPRRRSSRTWSWDTTSSTGSGTG